MMIKSTILSATWLLVLSVSLQAGTYTASSCSYAAVNNKINGTANGGDVAHTAVDGDVINIPAGTCAWSSQMTVSVGISIVGAGAATTTLQHAFNGQMFVVNIPSATSSTFRLTAMTLAPGTGSQGQPALMDINGTCNSSTCSNIRLDHMTIATWADGTNFSGFLVYADNVFGVLDHLTVTYTTGGEFVNVGHSAYGGVGQYGDNSWATANSYGSSNALYIEDNTFSTTNTNGMAITDTDHGGGGRFVGRFNTMTNANYQTHGTESTGRPRGGRQYEIYNNNLTLTSGATGEMIGWRSGTGLVFNNTKTGVGTFNAEIGISNYREGNGFYLWGACDGQGQWDQNDGVTYASGTVTGVNMSGGISITDSGKTWTTSQWVANPSYSMVNMTQTDSQGFHPGFPITANTATNASSSLYNSHGGEPNWTVGDSYQILKATACTDQPGRGGAGATLLSNWPMTPTGWTNQPLDPIYEWGSTTNAGPAIGWVNLNWITKIAANRDYYFQNASFNGTTGTGTGTLASRPSTCTAGTGGAPGVAYWATDQGSWNSSGSGGQGQLYLCTATNTWTLSYTPYNYPHPLASGTISPTVTTTSATNITSNSASSGGSVTNDGGATVTSEGVCYAATTNPTTPCTSDGTATPFTSTLTGLVAGTLYHYRAFATNSAGTGYGSDLTFTTSGGITPSAKAAGGAKLGGGAVLVH